MTLDQVLENSIKYDFDVCPVAMRHENIYSDLAEHLKNNVMSIDIWEGDDETA